MHSGLIQQLYLVCDPMKIRINSNSKNVSHCIYLDCMSEPLPKDDSTGVYMGDTSIYRIPLIFRLDEMMNKNIAVLGMSGSGKSFFLKNFIIKSRILRNSTILVIDWNNEYSEVIEYLGGTVLKLGSTFRINIFALYDLRSTKNAGRISKLVGSALGLSDEETYLVYNKILLMCSDKKIEPNLKNLIISMAGGEEKEERLSRKLLQLNDNPMFADKTDFYLAGLTDGVMSIDFSSLKDDHQRGETSRAILGLVVELMHKSELADGPERAEKIIVLDEAWRLIRNSEDIGTLFREGRKYGFCIAVATQLVNDINSEILSNAASVFLFRLQNDNDYKLLLESGIITQSEKEKIIDLPIGSCMVSTALRENSGTVSKFFLERIKGVEISRCKIKGDGMQMEISKTLFLSSTGMLLVRKDTKERIVNFCSESGNELDLRLFIRFLLALKIDRAEIIFYLRRMGVHDINIVTAYDASMGLSIKKDD
jgi:hypothetical protein